MPEWKRLPGEAVVKWEYIGNGWRLRCGRYTSSVMTIGLYQEFSSFGPENETEAIPGILAHAKRLHRMADEIEAAVASAPKEMPDAKA